MTHNILSNHHLDMSWLHIAAHKISEFIRSPKLWAAIAVCALILAFIALAMLAGETNSPQTIPFYEYPGYMPIAP